MALVSKKQDVRFGPQKFEMRTKNYIRKDYITILVGKVKFLEPVCVVHMFYIAYIYPMFIYTHINVAQMYGPFMFR